MKGLNHRMGIVPHAHHLGWEKKEQVDGEIKPKWLKARVKVHCGESTSFPTPFSSWSHDWRTALAFSLRLSPIYRGEKIVDYQSCHIAVLDTWTLGDENMLRNKIFFVDQFGIPNCHCLCEWLIWGPVSGPAYRCVPLAVIQQATNCRVWPHHLTMKSTPYLVHADIRKSMAVAGCFQRIGDGSADVMLAVAAAELARIFWGRHGGRVYADGEPEAMFDTEPLWPRHVLKEVLDVFALWKPVLSVRPLVHGDTAIEGFPRVSLMYDLLLAVEARWRNNELKKRWVWADFTGWQIPLCEACVKRGNYGRGV